MELGKQLAHPGAAGGIECGLGPVDLAQSQNSRRNAEAAMGVLKECVQECGFITEDCQQNQGQNPRNGKAQLGGRHHEKQGAAPAG